MHAGRLPEEGEGVSVALSPISSASPLNDDDPVGCYPMIRSFSSRSETAKDLPLDLPLSPSATATYRQVQRSEAQSCCPPSDISRHSNIMPRSSARSLRYRIQQWWTEAAWPGMGLFGESYLLFSIGTLRPLWQVLYPDCFFDADVCHPKLVYSLSYTVVVGIILGMILIGTLANGIGRRFGSILTASLMAVGALGMTATSIFASSDPKLLFRWMIVMLFIFGVGVGGEYPLSASSASERAMGIMRRKMALELVEEEKRRKEEVHRAPTPPRSGNPTRLVESKSNSSHNPNSMDDEDENTQIGSRGKRILLVFSMQGVGIFINSLALTIFLIMTQQFGQDGNNYDDDANANAYEEMEVQGTYDSAVLLGIWRMIYAIGAVILVCVLVGRILYLKESAVWKDDRMRREQLAIEAETRKRQGSFFPPNLARSPDSFTQNKNLFSKHNNNSDGHSNPILGKWDPGNDPPSIELNSTVSSLSIQTDLHDPSDNILFQLPSTTAEEDRNSSSRQLLLRNYGPRLVGTSMSWLLWDIAFYGNKLFQSNFLIALAGERTTLLEISGAATLNALVALLGYFVAALIIDKPVVGRLRLQQWGSSFFGQCGPNATTFLIPAEIFPTEMRTMCHGISASAGKVGALIAAILFNYVSGVQMFLISGYASFAASFITFLAIPETSTLDLYEIDRRWRMIIDGRKMDYDGPANNPEHLSFYERSKLGLNY
eukprot:scaffold88801_cov55-Attheya_sp.AAC.5